MLEHDWLSNALTMWWCILQVGLTISTRVALPESFLVSALSLITSELNCPTSFPAFALLRFGRLVTFHNSQWRPQTSCPRYR